MNQLISNIKNIPGVEGVAIFKDNGGLVAYDFPKAYDMNLLNLMGLKFQPIKEILPLEEGEIVYLCWEYEDLLTFYYPVGGGWVSIISSDHVPMPVFSLTMTAVASKLPGLLEEAEVMKVKGQEQPAVVTTENTVPLEQLEELGKFFATYLGPASAVIFKRVAHHLGFTLNNIPKDNLAGLLRGVIAKVPGDKKDEVKEKIREMSLNIDL
jgi:hypothetical protein